MRLGHISPEVDVDMSLHRAAENGELQSVKLLLTQGHYINGIDFVGQTPLHFAVEANQLDMVEYLVAAGADINGQADGDGWQADTPLGSVAGTCSIEMARLLMQLGADPNCPGWMGCSALDRAEDRKDDDRNSILYILKMAHFKST